MELGGKLVIVVCILPGFGWCMLTVWIGDLAFSNMFKLVHNCPIIQFCLQQDCACSLQIFGTICWLYHFSTPTFGRMMMQATCWLCIALVQILTNVPPVLTLTPPSCTFKYVSMTGNHIVNVRWCPEEDIDRWSPFLRQSFCHTNGQFSIWCDDQAMYPIWPCCFL